MKQLLQILSLMIPLVAPAQKWDYQWPMGYSNAPLADVSILDFNEGEVSTNVLFQTVDDFTIGSTGSFICDKSSGEVILMTNGCRVYDADLQVVSGSDTLSPGPTYNNYCEDEYPAYQSILILPNPTTDSIYYVLHKDGEINNTFQDVVSHKLYLTTIVRYSDNSFTVVEKRLLLDTLMNVGKLTACINHDGTKWWTWTTGYDTNKFYKFLIGGTEIVEGPFEQEIGDPLYNKILGIGQTAFSPNTKVLGLNSGDKKVKLYDFDNETGELSNFRAIPYPDDGDGARGLVFSPNSQLVYVGTVFNLYQIDMLNSSVEHIAYHMSYDEFNWPVTIGYLHLGPDCRLYADCGSTSHFIHVIHHPDEKGEGCEFQARAIPTLSTINFEFPNIPMYRFDGACDSSITFPVSGLAIELDGQPQAVSVAPNPCSGVMTVTLQVQATRQVRLLLFDMMGRSVLDKALTAARNELDVEGLAPGLYFYEVRDEQRLLGSGKLVRVE